MQMRTARDTAIVGTTTLLLSLFAGSTATAAEPPPTCAGRTATIVGTDGDDDLEGTDGPDVVSLGAGDDRFDGRGGDDVVCGGPGNDFLNGGLGDDELYGEDGIDSLIGESGWDLAAGDVAGDDLLSGGPGNDRLRAEPLGAGVDVGGDGADIVLGGEGDDTITVWSGDTAGTGKADVVDGGDGWDILSYSDSPVGVVITADKGTAKGDAVDTFTGVEAYRGTNFPDVLRGTDGPDHIEAGRALGGADHVIAGPGDDWLSAEVGTVDAGSGNDYFESDFSGELDVNLGRGRDHATVSSGHGTRYRGGPGSDVFTVVDANDGHDYDGTNIDIVGGKGHDELTFAPFFRGIDLDVKRHLATARRTKVRFHKTEEYWGTRFADTLLGSGGADRLHGLGGPDLLRGRAGDDVLLGGDDEDTAYGGPGRDVCDAERRVWCERRP